MLIDAADSVLLVVDVQERLMPVIHQGEAIVDRLHKLSQAARLLDVPVLATEHHNRMLGVTVEPLHSNLDAIFKKMHFSAIREPGFAQTLPAGRKTFLLTGCEARMCAFYKPCWVYGRMAIVCCWSKTPRAHASLLITTLPYLAPPRQALKSSPAKWRCSNGWKPANTLAFARC